MSDLIDRRAALEALAEAMPSLTTPDGCGQFDHDIQVTDEAYVDCMQIIHELPSIQPGWIPCSSALPEHDENVLICAKNYEDCKWYEELTARVCDCIPGETSTQVLEFGCKHGACGDCDMESQKPYWLHILVGWFSDGEWDGNGLTDGEEVVAWMELPQPWEGGQDESDD